MRCQQSFSFPKLGRCDSRISFGSNLPPLPQLNLLTPLSDQFCRVGPLKGNNMLTHSCLVDCPTQLTLIFILWYLYLSVVFHDKYQSYKYEKIQQGNLLPIELPRTTKKHWSCAPEICLQICLTAAGVGKDWKKGWLQIHLVARASNFLVFD